MTADLLIHLGMRKTATSWFQKEYLDNHPGLRWLDVNEVLYDMLVYPSEPAFRADDVRSAVLGWTQAAREAGQLPVISMPELAGDAHVGGWNRFRTARRLRETFPQAPVWVALREQRSAILSSYRQFVRAGAWWPLDYYMFGAPKRGISTPRVDYWRYDGYVEALYEVFGRENVLVTLFERFKEDPGAVVERVEAFADVDSADDAWDEDWRPARALSDPSVAVMRWLNRWIGGEPKYGPRPGLGLPGRQKMANALMALDDVAPWLHDVEFIEGRAGLDEVSFAASNRRLSKLVDEDLEAWGYEVSEG